MALAERVHLHMRHVYHRRMYAPEQHVPYRAVGPGPGFKPMGSGLRSLFAAFVAISTLSFVAVIVLWTTAIAVHPERPNDTLMGSGFAFMVAVVFLLYAQIFTGMGWLYKAWAWLPCNERYTANWRSWITPAQAACFLFIPYFHYYWMFVINTGLCDALERLRVRYPTRTPSPKGLAIAACICQLIIPLPVGAILWLLYMSRIEKMTREMAESAAPGGAPLF